MGFLFTPSQGIISNFGATAGLTLNQDGTITTLQAYSGTYNLNYRMNL
jgi:hypothetical protein